MMNSEQKDELLTEAAILPNQCYTPFSREVFVEAINSIQSQYERDKECAEKIEFVFPDAFTSTLMYDNSLLLNQIVKLLQLVFNDNHAHSWIEYYLWELDFGKENYRLHVSDKDGKNIPLSNAGELYDLLIKSQNNGL